MLNIKYLKPIALAVAGGIASMVTAHKLKAIRAKEDQRRKGLAFEIWDSTIDVHVSQLHQIKAAEFSDMVDKALDHHKDSTRNLILSMVEIDENGYVYSVANPSYSTLECDAKGVVSYESF